MTIVGTIFEDKYEIIEVLGHGGMSTVYLGRDRYLQKLWTIKQVDKNRKLDLMAEINILKKLNHLALPSIVDIISKEDYLYLVFEFIDGISLDKKLKEHFLIDEETLVNWSKQLCNVLLYLHSQSPNPIIYRDMKPGNIILTKQGEIKLIDFGIAREFKEDLSNDTTYIGTRGYAAPEQYGNYQTDARTDIYSLGVTMYHLATGKGPNEPPFELKLVREIQPILSEGLEKIILKCTQQDPTKRYQSVTELLYDLENIHKLNLQFKKSFRRIILKIPFISAFFVLLKNNKKNKKTAKQRNTREKSDDGTIEDTESL